MIKNPIIAIGKFALLMLISIISINFVHSVENYGTGTYGSGIFGLSECGNGFCESGESCSSCSADCGACPAPAAPPAVGGGGGGGGGPLIAADYRWECTEWSECTPEGIQTRTCTNLGTGPGTFGKPEENRTCEYLKLPGLEEFPVIKPVRPTPKVGERVPTAEKPAALEGITGLITQAVENAQTAIGVSIVAAVVLITALVVYNTFIRPSRKR